MKRESVIQLIFWCPSRSRWTRFGRGALIALGVAFFLLGGCSGAPEKPEAPEILSAPETSSQDLARMFNQAKLAYLSGEHPLARELLLPLAKSDHAEAQYVLGYMMFYGQGGEMDLEQAHAWFRLSAEQGNAKAFQAIARINQAREKLVNGEPSVPQE